MITISIIIPIFNSEKTLKNCLFSIVNQVYNKLDIILVNDGSTDNSARICEEFARKDSRIRVFNKENGGASSARNEALKHTLGQYICFIDSDDTVNENYVKDLYNGLCNPDIDLVFQGFNIVKGNLVDKKAFGEEIIKANQLNILFINKEIFKYGYICSKLFKSSIIQQYGLEFPESYNFAEDLSFMLRYISHCNSIHFQEKFNYNYIYHAQSSSNTFKSSVEYLNRYHDYQQLLKEDYPIIYEDVYGKNKIFVEFCRSVGGAIFYYIQSIYLNKSLKRNERIKMLKKIECEDKILLNNFIKHLKNPFYIIALKFICINKYVISDTILINTIKVKN